MNVLMIHATMRKSSTYHTAHMLAESLTSNNQIHELFLPEAMPEFCLGCAKCVIDGEDACPHKAYTQAIAEEMDWADVLILASPVYVMHTAGSMKVMLDHFAYRFMVHRPCGAMFCKQAVAVTTAAGGGNKSAAKDMTDSLHFWGVGRVYRYGINVAAANWRDVSEPKREKIRRQTGTLAKQILCRAKNPTPSLRTKANFFIMRKVSRLIHNPADLAHWEKNGWYAKVRPWHGKI